MQLTKPKKIANVLAACLGFCPNCFETLVWKEKAGAPILTPRKKRLHFKLHFGCVSAVHQITKKPPNQPAVSACRKSPAKIWASILFQCFINTIAFEQKNAHGNPAQNLSVAKAVTEAHGGTVRAAYKDSPIRYRPKNDSNPIGTEL